MRRLRKAQRQKRTELWKKESFKFFTTNETKTADLFYLIKLKTPMKRKRFATIEKIKEKVETGAVGDTKKCISGVFRVLEKTLT